MGEGGDRRGRTARRVREAAGRTLGGNWEVKEGLFRLLGKPPGNRWVDEALIRHRGHHSEVANRRLGRQLTRSGANRQSVAWATANPLRFGKFGERAPALSSFLAHLKTNSQVGFCGLFFLESWLS